MKSLTIVFALAGTLIGCASTPVKYEGDAKHSEAWNIARAAGIGDLRDVPYEKYAKAREDAMRRGQLLDDGPGVAGTVAFSAANYSSPPTGFSNGSAMLMGGLAWMMAPSESHAVDSRFFAWMPKAMAATPEAAEAKLHEIVLQAMSQAMQETPLPAGYRYVGVETTKRFLLVRIDGPGCDRQTKRCAFIMTKPTRPSAYPAPTFVHDTNEVWAWRAYPNGARNGVAQGQLFVLQSKAEMSRPGDIAYPKTWSPGFPDLAFYLALSKALPEWCSVYLAPKRWSAQVDSKWTLPPYPVVLNQGRVLHFVEPAPPNATS